MSAAPTSLLARARAALGLDGARPPPDPLPLRHEIRAADLPGLRADLSAAARIALFALPFCLVFSAKAGLPAWSGLLGAGVAAIVAPIFTGSAAASAGPSGATAALLVGIFAAAGGTSPETRLALLPALLAMTALFLLAACWLRLGGVAAFVPRAVVAALLAAAAVRVLVQLLPVALGIPVDPEGSPFRMLAEIATGLPAAVNPNLAAALAAGVVFAAARPRMGLGPAALTALGVTAFFAMVAENVALATGPSLRQGLFAYVGAEGSSPTPLTPALAFHNFSTLFSPALALALLILVEAAATARSSARRLGRPADLAQQAFGLGFANLACGAAGGLPASASAARTEAGLAAGARGGLASVFAGIALLAALQLGGGLLAKVPLAALAVAALAVERELVNLPAVREVLRSGRERRAVFLVTFSAGLVAPLDIALYLGIAVAVSQGLRGSEQAPSPGDAAVDRADWSV